MKLSANIFGREFSFGAIKSISPDAAAFITGTDIEDNGAANAKMVTPYAQSSWVYVAVNRLAQKVSSIPFRISRVGSGQAKKIRALRGSSDPRHKLFCRKSLGETIIESGDVVDLFERPHPTMNRQLFWEMVVTWNCLRGEFFILPLDASDSPVDLAGRAPRVQRLITVPTELFWQVVVGYELEAWRYTGSPLLTPIPGEMLSPTEVVYSRSPNPYLYWRGLSPLLLAMGPAGADFAASKYNQGYWLNNADTGLIVTTENWPTDDQRKAILTALRERKRKAGTPDRPMLLGGGVKVEKPALSGMEQAFIENRKMNRQEIGSIYGVPDSIMGFSEQKSSALSGGGNAIEQDGIAFIENTIQPLCSHLEAAVAPVVMTFGDDLIGWFDMDSLPIMQAARRARIDTAVKAFGIGVPLNDIVTAYDLGFKKYGWGDKSFLPFNLQEITKDGLGGNEPSPSEDDPAATAEGDKEKSNPFSRLKNLLTSAQKNSEVVIKKPDLEVLWNSHITTRRKTVKMMQSKVSKVLMQFRSKTLAKLDEVHLQKDAKQLPSEIKSVVDLIFSASEFGQKLFDELKIPITSTLQLAGNELNEELGVDDPWQMPPQKAKDFLAARTQAIHGVGGTVRDQLNTSLQEGLDEGETTSQLSDRVKAVYNGLGDYEAKRVAQTETNMAYNSARHDAMGDAGIEYKAWLSSHGPHVREAHAIAEEQYIDAPIPIDDPFEVMGEELMFPGDDSMGASAGNIINCQCIQIAAQPVTGTDDAEKFYTFKIYGIGEMKFLRASTMKEKTT